MSVLIAIVALNVAVSLLGFRALAQPASPAAERFLFIPAQVARGENGRGMLLAHFSHGSVTHLAFNMIALYSFGDGVLTALGPWRFLLVYALAGLGSDLVVFALRKDEPTYRCLGASGSVFGIMTAAVVLDPGTSVMLFFVPIPIPGPVFLLAYAVISVVLIAQKRRGGISHEGHLGGAILGLAVTALLAPRGLDPLVQWFVRRL
ncbi:MAG TPA: rhomboid family intramembrane serine protease [Methylomirabilota bacterium]|jgi:membrane associated rhomboid family serine protease